MKIAMIQIQVTENIHDNIEQFKNEAYKQKSANVIVLCEMWNVPYENVIMKKSASYQEETIDAMRTVSSDLHTWIIGGSICIKEGSQYYNACLIFHDGELVCTYAKTHLMEFHGRKNYSEADVFTPGHQLVTFKIGSIKAGVVICYDIRFPELARLLTIHGIQILFVPAAFNQAVGKLHWKPLLQTRAMENQIFVVGCSPAEYTYKNYISYGHSLICDPFGSVILEMDEKHGGRCIDIDLHQIEKIRKRMPFAKIRRNDLYELKEVNNEQDIDS